MGEGRGHFFRDAGAAITRTALLFVFGLAQSLRAERLLTCNDALWPGESQPPPYFSADLAIPSGLVFPPTLLIEALCQAAACFNSLAFAAAAPDSSQPARPHHGYLVAIRDFKFPAFVYVGETLMLEVAQQEKLGQVIAFAVRATVKPPMPPMPTDPDNPADLAEVQPRQVASGRLLGGNLEVLSRLCGTPLLQALLPGEPVVLLIEEVTEAPYRIDRMLTQLLHAGILAQQKAIVLGQFTRFSVAMLWLSFQSIAFAPVMRSHEGNRPDDNLQYDSSAELLACFARWSRVHAHLAPYVRHLCNEAQALGLPAQRALFLHYPDDSALFTLQDQYLYGADLLVAPVIEQGAHARTVVLPGTDHWVHCWTGESFAPGTHVVPAPIGRPPVFYRPDSAFAPLFAGLAASLLPLMPALRILLHPEELRRGHPYGFLPASTLANPPHAALGDDIIGSVLLNMAVFGAMLSYIMQAVSFIILRRNLPELEVDGEMQTDTALSPVIRERKGEHLQVFEQLRAQGYTRVRVNGQDRKSVV